MPGIVLNPIANFAGGVGQQPPPPYIPTYDSIYVCGDSSYQISGSHLGSVTISGLGKMDFSGSLDTTWNNTVNQPPPNTNYVLQLVRYSQGARGTIMMDNRILSGSSTFRETRLIDKATGATSQSIIHPASGGDIRGMVTDTQEEYVYCFGEYNMQITGSDATSGGIARFEQGTLNPDIAFEAQVGDGPTHPGGAISNKNILDVHVNPNGKIGVAHSGTGWNNTNNKYNNLVILNQDGTVDTNFDFGSSIFGNQYSDPIPNGAVLAVTWAPSGSAGIWIVGGKFETFAGNSNYKRIMAFNEDGSINTSWTTNFQENTPGNNLNSDVYDLKLNPSFQSNYLLILGGFTAKGGNSGWERVMAAQASTGFPQISLNQTPNETATIGVINDDILYWLYRGESNTDRNNDTDNAFSMGAIDVYSFNHPADWDIGDGIKDSTGTNPVYNGTVFLG